MVKIITSLSEFVNREYEVLFMAREYASNLHFACAGDVSTHNPTLITASQMFGSGKTWLGKYFLPILRDNMYTQVKKIDLSTESDIVSSGLKILLASVYLSNFPSTTTSLI